MTQYIYFARCVGMDGPIKIGCSSFPWQRVKTLSIWAPYPVELLHQMPGNYLIERRIHAYFADLHSHSEWFRVSPGLVNAIDRLKAGEPLESVIDMDATGSIRSERTRTEESRARHSATMKAAWARKRERGETWGVPRKAQRAGTN